jgi:hypothetical protein
MRNKARLIAVNLAKPLELLLQPMSAFGGKADIMRAYRKVQYSNRPSTYRILGRSPTPGSLSLTLNSGLNGSRPYLQTGVRTSRRTIYSERSGRVHARTILAR